MKQSYFIIAESVHMYPVGKLVIVGTFDTINATTFPSTFGPFGIAVRLEAKGAERGRTHNGLLTLRKRPEGEPMLSVHVDFSFPKGKGERRTFALLALGVSPLKFDFPGNYVFELKAAGKLVARSSLYVRRVAEDDKARSRKKVQRLSSARTRNGQR